MRRLTWVVVALALSATVSLVQANTSGKKLFSTDFKKLNEYLTLEPHQRGEVSNILEYFDHMQSESLSRNAERQERNVKKAVFTNLKLMKSTLSDEQFKKYVTLINVTNNNNNILKEYTLIDK